MVHIVATLTELQLDSVNSSLWHVLVPPLGEPIIHSLL